MIPQELGQIDVMEHVPLAKESSPVFARVANGIAKVDLSSQERAELLDAEAWGPMLETYGRTMKVAVALTDAEGNLLGRCHNAQPVWTLIHGTIVDKGGGCPFCLTPPS